jgi:hypothetical protein
VGYLNQVMMPAGGALLPVPQPALIQTRVVTVCDVRVGLAKKSLAAVRIIAKPRHNGPNSRLAFRT